MWEEVFEDFNSYHLRPASFAVKYHFLHKGFNNSINFMTYLTIYRNVSEEYEVYQSDLAISVGIKEVISKIVQVLL